MVETDKKIFFGILMLIISMAFIGVSQESLFYEVELYYKDGNIRITNASILKSNESLKELGGNYILAFFDRDARLINERYFPFLSYKQAVLWNRAENETYERRLAISEQKVNILTPYLKKARIIQLYKVDSTDFSRKLIDSYQISEVKKEKGVLSVLFFLALIFLVALFIFILVRNSQRHK